jgi:hypothetical protein
MNTFAKQPSKMPGLLQCVQSGQPKRQHNNAAKTTLKFLANLEHVLRIFGYTDGLRITERECKPNIPDSGGVN